MFLKEEKICYKMENYNLYFWIGQLSKSNFKVRIYVNEKLTFLKKKLRTLRVEIKCELHTYIEHLTSHFN